MKNDSFMKLSVFVAAVLLPAIASRGDILPPPEPLRRIGYEVLVEVAAAVAGGSMLLRWVAKKVWKHPYDVTRDEVAGFEDSIARILPTLRSKFDEEYKVNSAEWLAEDERRRPQKPANDEIADCHGLTDFEGHTDSELARLKFVAMCMEQRGLELPYLRNRRLGNAWRTLCNDLLFSILESDAELRKECDGIPIELLCDAMFTGKNDYNPPKGYEGYYQKANMVGLDPFTIRAALDEIPRKPMIFEPKIDSSVSTGICSNCGYKVSQGARFCSYCGQKQDR